MGRSTWSVFGIPVSSPCQRRGGAATANLPPIPDTHGERSGSQDEGRDEKPPGINAPLQVPVNRLGGVKLDVRQTPITGEQGDTGKNECCPPMSRAGYGAPIQGQQRCTAAQQPNSGCRRYKGTQGHKHDLPVHAGLEHYKSETRLDRQMPIANGPMFARR
jgi:hypothetical protein